MFGIIWIIGIRKNHFSSNSKDNGKNGTIVSDCMWIEDMTKKRLPLDGNVVRQKALKIFNYLKETGQPSTDEDRHQFVKIQGERASADTNAADKYSEEFAKIIKEHDHLPDQIFNADETDQRITATFNRKSVELTLEKTESSNITVKEVWKQLSILNCVLIVGTSLKEVCQSTLRACLKALLPEAAVQEIVANPTQDEYRNVVRLANVIRGDGFDEITVDDIRELITDDEINEADLVAMTNEASSIEDSSDDLSNAQIENFSLKSAEKIWRKSWKRATCKLLEDTFKRITKPLKRIIKKLGNKNSTPLTSSFTNDSIENHNNNNGDEDDYDDEINDVNNFDYDNVEL
uniref:Uncharacterized protein n=1 Tax=Glossina austeni TaxID=7395 RepID=A0A1A9VDM2_GLOAU